MSHRILTAAAALALSAALPVAALAQSSTGSGVREGARSGADAGSSVLGPVGGAVGGIVGGVVGGVAGTAGAIIEGLTPDQSTRVRRYVVEERRPSVRVTERVVVGEDLPSNVELYAFPSDYGVTQYRYTVVNERRVLVDPRSRRIVEVFE